MRIAAALALLLVPALQDAADKLDPELKAPGKHHAIFVRMADQLLPDGAAHPKFCAARAGADRRELRREVLRALKEKSDAAAKRLGPLLGKLEKAGALKSTARFWIVNGFAGEATSEACEALAADPAVAYVHLQRGPAGVRQQVPVAASSAAMNEEQSKRTAAALELVDAPEPAYSAEGLELPWNVERIGAPGAWKDGATGEGIVVAVADSGLLPIPPLLRALWRNPGEKLNGKDDDGNGWIDDVFGYDFTSNSGWVLDDPGVPHGSACGGIIAGRPAAPKGIVTGVAPRARLMMLRGMGYLRSYEYALEMGADVLSMSYMWVGMELGHYRGVFRTAHEHLDAAGIVAAGGAGNFGQSHPDGRQIAVPKDIPCVLAAAGVDKNGAMPKFSSRGPVSWKGVKFFDDHPDLVKPDVTTYNAGFPCWSRADFAKGPRFEEVWKGPDGTWGLYVGLQGNSFAGPHVAGVAALVLSARPDLPAWKVRELLVATCEDLGDKGPDVATGAGRMRAAEAVAAARAAGK